MGKGDDMVEKDLFVLRVTLTFPGFTNLFNTYSMCTHFSSITSQALCVSVTTIPA